MHSLSVSDIPAPQSTVSLKITFMHEEYTWQSDKVEAEVQALNTFVQVPAHSFFNHKIALR